MSKTERFKRLQESRDAENSNPQKPEVINKIVGDFESIIPRETINSIHEHTAVSLISNTTTEHEQVILNSNTNDEQYDVIQKSNSDTEQSNVIQNGKTSSRTRIPRPIEEFEKRLKRPTIEQTHTRATWLIRNDFLKRLDKLAKNQQRGFKTHLVNYALERILDELESK